MHARRITLAVALAGLIGVGTVAAVRADDAASPAGPGAAPTPDESAPQANNTVKSKTIDKWVLRTIVIVLL